MSHPITDAITRSHRAVLAQHGISADVLPLDEMAHNAAQAVLSGLECGSIVVAVDLEDVRAAVSDAKRIALCTLILRDRLVLDGRSALVGALHSPPERAHFLSCAVGLSQTAVDVVDDDMLDGATHEEILDAIGYPVIAAAAAAVVDGIVAIHRIAGSVAALGDSHAPPEVEICDE